MFVQKDEARVSRLLQAASLTELFEVPAVASYLGTLLAARR